MLIRTAERHWEGGASAVSYSDWLFQLSSDKKCYFELTQSDHRQRYPVSDFLKKCSFISFKMMTTLTEEEEELSPTIWAEKTREIMDQ